MTAWNYGDIWETVAGALPDAPAIVQGARRLSYGALRQRANGVARRLVDAGATHQDKVAIYLHNAPEYLETVWAAIGAVLVPVNTNYRYVERELAYLWDNADAVAVVFHGCFADHVAAVRPLVPGVRLWLWVDDGTSACPAWAEPYEDAARREPEHVQLPWERTPDDLVMLYTGGTTGLPKGVMWRQDDLFVRMQGAGFRRYDLDAGLDGVRQMLEAEGPGMTLAPACPLMHGTGLYTSLECLSEGGRVVLFDQPRMDPAGILDTVEREGVNVLVIVGDPFARPLADALDAEPHRWSLASLVAVISSGAMWSAEVKDRLLHHHRTMTLIDAFSSSEALGMGASVSSGAATARTGQFILGPEVRVLGPDDRDVEPGSGEIGVLALGGRNPLGYYKDPDKSAATFRVIDGVRYSVPGDHATVNEDGTVHLLGRGSVSINTGGEKVYPEEVEEALKVHPAVRDACVVGVPSERYGEAVVAVVELDGTGRSTLDGPGGIDGATAVDGAALVALVKDQLAGYKAPRHVLFVESIGRSPAGKVDYRRHRDAAVAAVNGSPASPDQAPDTPPPGS